MHKKVNNAIIIGLGNLGSRHLQSMAKCISSLRIDAVDPSEESIRIAKERAEQVQKTRGTSISFFSKLQDTNTESYDLAIIATGSKNRAAIIESLLKEKKVFHIIIEKVLFQSIEEYWIVDELLESQNVEAWVNCPRRSYPIYNQLFNTLNNADSIPKFMHVSGGSWGLACNGIHFIDLFAYLSKSKVESVSTSNLTNSIFESKRKGYLEFFGTLNITFQNGAKVSLTCLDQEKDVELKIGTAQFEVNLNETKGICLHDRGETSLSSSFEMLRQSDLTEVWIESLNKGGEPSLPRYKESKELHLKFIESLLAFYNDLTKENHSCLPIT